MREFLSGPSLAARIWSAVGDDCHFTQIQENVQMIRALGVVLDPEKIDPGVGFSSSPLSALKILIKGYGWKWTDFVLTAACPVALGDANTDDWTPVLSLEPGCRVRGRGRWGHITH